MLRVKTYIDVKEAVRRGHPSDSPTILEIHDADLASWTEREREELSECLVTPLTGRTLEVSSKAEATEPTITGLLEGIRIKMAADAKRAAQDAEHQAKAEEIVSTVTAERISSLYDEKSGNLYRAAMALAGDSDVPAEIIKSLITDRFDESEITARYDAREAAEREDRKQAEAKRNQELKDSLAKAKEIEHRWIAENGSERLKRLVAENIEYQAVYRDERLAKERPGWVRYFDVPGQLDDPRNPPLEAFKTLDAARQVDPKAVLQWYTEDHEHSEDCGYEDECPRYDVEEYVATAEFMGDTIIFGL